jgi:hypothetical protein
MIEPQLTPFDIRDVGKYIVPRNFHKPILNVLGVNELPFVDKSQILKKRTTG